MKKFAVVGVMLLALGATAFARGHKNWDNYEGGRHNFGHSSYSCQPFPKHMNSRRSPEMEKSSIIIEEKRLEIRKELLNENPDWNKIEKLNTEISNEIGKMRTAGMKARFEYNKTLPNQNQL